MIGAVCAALALNLAGGEVVAVKALPRGAVLTEGMIEARGDANASALLGRQLKRPVFAGKPISPEDVAAPDLVTRQSSVSVTYARGGLTLSLPGRALGAGGVGEAVSVLIEGRRRPVRAVVTGPGVVAVTP